MLSQAQAQQNTRYSSGSYLYPLEKNWFEDLKCYVQKSTRKFTGEMSCNEFPRPLSMSRDGNNDYVEEKIWKQLVKIFGVDKSHDLSRIHAKDYTQVHYFNDYVMTKVDVILSNHDIAQLGMFPSLWMFPKEERLGYIMTQLRHYYNVPRGRRSRLWYTPTLPTSWLVTNLNKTVCNIRAAIYSPASAALNGIKGAEYVEIAKDKFANSVHPTNQIQFGIQNNNPLRHNVLYSHAYRNSLDASYTVSEFSENAGCSPIFGLLVLEVEKSIGKWPTKRHPHLVPENSFDLQIDSIYQSENDVDDVNKINASKVIEKQVKNVIDKLEQELQEEMLTVYDGAKAKGEQKCEKLENRETYMHELEEGLRLLQDETNGLKSRLRDLRGRRENV